MERKLLFNDGWKFTKQEIGAELDAMNGESVSWSEVDLPHDWLIYNTNDLYETSEGWYKKSFTVDQTEDRVISICFEGVYMDSTVFVNAKAAGEWKYGYSSFEFDITKYLRPGVNEIKVRVVNQSLNTRWYSGAGIYRNVWLKTTAPVHLVTNGIYIATRKTTEGWYAEIDTEAVNDGVRKEPVKAVVKHTILNPYGREAAVSQSEITINHSVTKDSQAILIKAPELWSLENPNLYTLKTQVITDGTVIDEETQSFGFRTTRFDSKEGFFLNDVHVKFHGANEHHDLGSLGSAVNKTAIRRQLRMLRDMGVNAIRLSHNMPSVEMMELADEMGFLIISEAFDMWERQKNDYDYARFFDDWHEKDVASWIRRDRNHPSIIMWSIGNEIYDTHASERGLEITKMLKQLVLTHDPKKNGQVTIGSNYMYGENAQKCADEVRAVGYNYLERLFEEQHDQYPDWYIFGSETGATLQSRGIYHFPASKSVVMYEDEQCSSLDNCATSWGVKSIQDSIKCYRDARYTLGQFVWTGFDYIGEPTPYTTKNSYYGQIDTAGFPKDSFYLYQAEWTDYKTSPMVHILPYWDFNEGQLIDIMVYSNAPKIELFFNGKTVGTQEIDHQHGDQLIGKWQLPYHPGTLKAVAYDKNGSVIATDSQSSFGDAAQIILKPDKTELNADGQDLIFVEISALDRNGIPVANANNRVEVEVSGAGRLVGLDNGDSTDYDQYKGTSRRLFAGKLLAIIAAKTTPGEIHMRVSSEGLKTEKVLLKAVPAKVIKGVSAHMENVKSGPKHEIPIRKIQLELHGSSRLNKQNPSVKVSAKLLPENAAYHEIEWKAVTTSGVETNIANIDTEGYESVITALGDGEFRLRCIARNGRTTPQILSDLEFEVTGMGTVTVDPYEFVDAALYNISNYEVDNGLLGGINTQDGSSSVLTYKGLDFGDYGTDEVTLPISYWSNDPIPVEIWEGIPGEEGAILLLKTDYQADWVWATFLPNTFKLPKRIKGIKTISFVFCHKLNLKGFQFKRIEKAYEKLLAKDNNQIYGDAYEITEEAVEHIGNNSSIEFENMDFGGDGFTKLIICGRSHTDNTIHILFENEEGSSRQSVEFPYTDGYEEKEFILDQVRGKQKVSFVFLPGCNFDFQWFRFVK